jgi:8-oxo-dGTP pyrophosphatase MutT (NUDIX family)
MKSNYNNYSAYMFRNIYCGNCGKKGHTFKMCKEPVTSFGVIAFRVLPDNTPEYLMICRKDSFGFVEFMRGRYSIEKIDYLTVLISEMTEYERKQILTNDFDTLWKKLWMNQLSPNFKTETNEARKSFNTIKKIKGPKNFLNLHKSIPMKWQEPEWGFPKGRRNLKEKDIDCAIREFTEETMISKDEILLFKNIKPLEEVFMGTNNVKYRHSYFIAKCDPEVDINVSETDKVQMAEVSDMRWLTFDKAKAKIREYSDEKIRILTQLDNIINNFILKYNGKLTEDAMIVIESDDTQ